MIKDEILKAQQDKKIIFFKKAFEITPGWSNFENVYNEAYKSNGVLFASFVSMTIDRAESYTDDFNDLIIGAQQLHPGNKICGMAIVHFENNNNQHIPEEAESLYKLFRSNGGTSIPPQFDFSLLVPARHSDPVDGIFIQCVGSTKWRAFYENDTKEYIAEPGDMLYIPKGIEHSVESLEARAAISIAFTDHK